MSAKVRIAITGTGAVCGAGITIDDIWNAITSGKSAVKEVSSFDASRWPVRVAAEVTGVDNRTLVEDRKLHKMISQTDLFGLYAAKMAIEQSGLLPHRETLAPEMATKFNDRSGVFAGSGGGNYHGNYDFFPVLTTAQGDLKKFGNQFNEVVNPMWLLRHLPNNVLCHVGIRHGFKGTNACVTNQCAGGVMALAEAAAAVRAGEADRAVAVGHDTPFEPETFFNFNILGLLANEAPRPFDRNRSGTVFGEGAAAVVFEQADDARARQASVLGEFLGSGCVTEGMGVLEVRRDGDGLGRAIELALADAGIAAGEVGMIAAHGNGTPASDASEARALKRVFGDNLPPVTSFKWAYGHLIAASGVIDLVLALRALREGVVPGIATLQTPDPEIMPFPVSARPQTPRSEIALVLCRGFGAMNIALLIRAARA